MKRQVFLMVLFISLQNFICAMDQFSQGAMSPVSTSDLASGKSTPSRVEYPKIDHGTRSIVFKSRLVGHEFDEITVIVPVKEVQSQKLTVEERAAAVAARQEDKMKPRGSCLKYSY